MNKKVKIANTILSCIGIPPAVIVAGVLVLLPAIGICLYLQFPFVPFQRGLFSLLLALAGRLQLRNFRIVNVGEQLWGRHLQVAGQPQVEEVAESASGKKIKKLINKNFFKI